jgi:uncharacterized protein (TIGR02391 family)
MWFLKGEVSLLKHEISWGIGGKIWTSDRYYSEGILKISLSLANFGLSQDRVAALKTFEDVVSRNNVDWIETRREEWIIDAEKFKQFVSDLAREKNAVAMPSLDDLKGFIPVKPEIDWDTSAVLDGGDKVYQAILGLHIFKETLLTAANVPRGLWDIIHPEVTRVARSRFESGHYADSVEAALKEVNSVVKRKVKDATGQETDGNRLMERAFSSANPVIALDDLSTESGRNIQSGYQRLFSGAMIGVRNPKAHENVVIDANRAMHFLFLASLLMHKLDEAR